MSRDLASLLLGGLRRLVPAGRSASIGAGNLAAAAFGQARQRVAAADPVSGLIHFVDRIESATLAAARFIRRSLDHRGLGLTGGLLWRGLAALTGIGLAATMVAALSPTDDPPSLGSLTVETRPDIRPVRDVRREPRALPVVDESWIKLVKPVAMFGLDAPELERQPVAYEAHRSQSGARRQDSLVFGGFAEPRPHLELRLLVEQAPDPVSAPFVIALVRDAAERGLSVQRAGLPVASETRFGPVETADVTLSDGASSRACIVFRKNAGELPLGLSGWWCGGAKPADRQQLTCLLDRLTLHNAGDDRALRTLFARQPNCVPPRLSASGRKASWLDPDGQAPALKTAARR